MCSCWFQPSSHKQQMHHQERVLVMIMQSDQVLHCCFCIHNGHKTIGAVVSKVCAEPHKAKMHMAQARCCLEGSKQRGIVEEPVFIHNMKQREKKGEMTIALIWNKQKQMVPLALKTVCLSKEKWKTESNETVPLSIQHESDNFRSTKHTDSKWFHIFCSSVIKVKKKKKRGVDKLVDGSTCCHTWTKKLDRTFKGKRRDGNRVCQKRLFILKDVWTQNREKNSCTILEHVIKYGPIVLLWTTVFQS